MPELNDHELLADFARSGSEEAFAKLVARHVNLVYSTALRFTGNSHHAEEITQAVFIILARKAENLSSRVVLSGWLYQTARLTAANFVKREIRRQRREQEAYMQSTSNGPDAVAWEQIAPLLDDAMGGLGETDRNVVVLRFFENKTATEVAATLKLSEAAAHKRTHRAMEKLRKFFAKRGVDSTTTVIGEKISAHSIQAAPVILAKSITVAALAKGATASSTLILAKATLIAMKTKTLVTTITAAVAVVGVSGYLVYHAQAARHSRASGAPSDTVPIKLANDSFKDLAGFRGDPIADQFMSKLDPDTRRMTNSTPSWHIKCLVEPTSAGSGDFLKSLTNFVARGLSASSFVGYHVETGSALSGKRIRISGWMKTSDVRNWAGVTMNIVNGSGRVFASDTMYDRPLHGTTDWQPIEMVTDVPEEPCTIIVLPTLYGTGEIWCDDFQIGFASSDTPVTDANRWTVWCQVPNDYSEAPDYNVTHDGHPSLCISYISTEAPEKNSFVWWGRHNRNLKEFEKYLGHTVRMSVWAKSENISARAGLDFQPKDGQGKQLTKSKGGPQIKGTTNWAQYSTTCVIPKDTLDFQTGYFMYGSGKYWIDTNSFKCEIVK